ncbi:helix-turn-helix domain-containing protein [Amycolatopsis sp. H20-H5]|uniref:helix-turn-helix domain-containing protein n=1 Tax=Amycolatopsis sp. H20-H5 TaxID=3046309 RepID=UPI002DB9E05E|nr:LysR family transcriptional regulator [Amycolatopsis sp. H20-H5]MEC3974931.1 LysR family transcriptional regulator [Amycolatopsis sp. H20-H5]
MTRRLPFTLTPLPAEPFGLWWHTYAVRLGVTRTELAHATGVPAGPPPGPGPEHAAAIAAATGLTDSQVAGMFASHRVCPPELVLRVWTPQPVSRFCPGCLSDGLSWRPAWALPLTFQCMVHHAPLAERCPACEQTPPSPATPIRTTQSPSSCPSCSHDLTTTAPQHTGLGDQITAAQKVITTALERMRDPAATAENREEAQDELTDLTLIAVHLSHGETAQTRGNARQMPTAAAWTAAVGLLVAPDPSLSRQDPLGPVVAGSFRRRLSRTIPASWHGSGPTLIARIARGREKNLTPIERIRYATTLPVTTPRPRRLTDPAQARAARLPDQLWPAWAIRLTDDDSYDGSVFRSAMAAALLLPHSDLPLPEITDLLPHQPDANGVAHQLRRLAATPAGDTALQILTELALAIDDAEIPIDYARRRHLVAHTKLIDKPTWTRLCRQAGLHKGRARRLDLAARYLYETLTGGNLATAPHSYRLPTGAPRIDYIEFCAAMPASLVTALIAHAENLLNAAGIDEPLSWQPPTEWVTVTSWPGADPDRTEPAPIHHAIREQWARGVHNHWAPTRDAAHALGISSHHLRYVLRRHPVTHAPYPAGRPKTLLAMTAEGGLGYRIDPHPDDPHRVYYIDPAWLREQYITWGRTLAHIASEIGCHSGSLRRFAEHHAIPRRSPGNGTCIHTDVVTGHPSHLPDPLRKALRGQRSRDRLDRFLVIIEHRSLGQAATTVHTTQPALTSQLHVLERACGGPLFHRRPVPQPLGPLTPLGEQLCQQAHDYLNQTSSG